MKQKFTLILDYGNRLSNNRAQNRTNICRFVFVYKTGDLQFVIFVAVYRGEKTSNLQHFKKNEHSSCAAHYNKVSI